MSRLTNPWLRLFPALAVFWLWLVPLAAEAQPAAALTPQAAVAEVLEVLHARGQGMRDLSAVVKLDEIDALTGDTTSRLGMFVFQDLGNGESRIRINFTAKRIGNREQAGFHQEYILDNGWLLDRDYARKTEIRRQVLQPGQKINLLKLGEGPFPLPIGQPPEEVHRLFEVKRIDPAPADPEKAVHLELAVRPDTQFARKFKKLDVWVDLAPGFPRRIAALDARGTTEHVTDLTEIKLNSGVTDRDFAAPPIDDTWVRREEALD
jgi:hypothetical protein